MTTGFCPIEGECAAFLEVSDGTRVSPESCAHVIALIGTLPKGGITGPAPGACFPASAGPVTVTDDIADACGRTELGRSYDPPGGPTYAGHGDYGPGGRLALTLRAYDCAGNAGEASLVLGVGAVRRPARPARNGRPSARRAPG